MVEDRRAGRYSRVYEQLKELLLKCDDSIARMATVAAVLKNKQNHFFWCGFYILRDGDLVVGPYQGSVACMKLRREGVCWAAVNTKSSVVVDDVEQFPGHIACDGRSRSEIVVPILNDGGEVIAVLDVDSDKLASFNDIDKEWLENIVKLVYK